MFAAAETIERRHWRVLVGLAHYADSAGSSIRPSLGTLARETQTDRRNLQRCIVEIRNLGILVLVHPGGRGPQSCNEYRLDHDRLATIAETTGARPRAKRRASPEDKGGNGTAHSGKPVAKKRAVKRAVRRAVPVPPDQGLTIKTKSSDARTRAMTTSTVAKINDLDPNAGRAFPGSAEYSLTDERRELMLRANPDCHPQTVFDKFCGCAQAWSEGSANWDKALVTFTANEKVSDSQRKRAKAEDNVSASRLVSAIKARSEERSARGSTPR